MEHIYTTTPVKTYPPCWMLGRFQCSFKAVLDDAIVAVIIAKIEHDLIFLMKAKLNTQVYLHGI